VCAPRAPPAGALLLHTAHTRRAQPPIQLTWHARCPERYVHPTIKLGRDRAIALLKSTIPNKSVGSSPFRQAESLSRTATWRPDNRPVASPFPTGADPFTPCGVRGLCKSLWLPPQANTLCLWVIRWRNALLCVLCQECPSSHPSRRALPLLGSMPSRVLCGLTTRGASVI